MTRRFVRYRRTYLLLSMMSALAAIDLVIGRRELRRTRELSIDRTAALARSLEHVCWRVDESARHPCSLDDDCSCCVPSS
jgi:hypothetical protein